MVQPHGRRSLRIATYNVHACVGGDGRRDPARIAAVIDAIAPDVIALQEVWFDHQDGGGQLAELARRTGMHPCCAALCAVAGGKLQGNAILSRTSPRQIARHDLAYPGKERRGVLEVEVEVEAEQGPTRLRVLATHLGLSVRERARQVQSLLCLVGRQPAVQTALIGDFNEWRPWARTVFRLNRALGKVPSPRSFPALAPILPLDRIWISPPPATLRVRAHQTARSRWASDHLPVVVELPHSPPQG